MPHTERVRRSRLLAESADHRPGQGAASSSLGCPINGHDPDDADRAAHRDRLERMRAHEAGLHDDLPRPDVRCPLCRDVRFRQRGAQRRADTPFHIAGGY